MQRVMIVGQPGSGKSWLAVQVGLRVGLPVHHMDHIHWQPGWIDRPVVEKIALCTEIEAREAWVFEGNFSATMPNRMGRADLVIWLDQPVMPRLWWVTRRKIAGLGRTRPDMAPGCPEGLGPEAWEFYRYIWSTRATGRARIAGQVAGAGDKLVRLSSRAEVAAFLGRV
jgi:adenylate kinase family enzyme